MDPVAPVGELDGTRNFVWPRGEPLHQRSVFDRNATQRTGEDFTIGTMHGDRPFRLAGARGNGDPFGARFPLVFLFEAAVDGADFHPQLRPAERDGRGILSVHRWQGRLRQEECEKREGVTP